MPSSSPTTAAAGPISDGLPMDMDGGIASLDQSRHHPNYGLSAMNDLTKAVANGTGGTPAEPDKCLPKATGSLPIKELLDRLLALVPMGLADQAKGLAREIFQEIQQIKQAVKNGESRRPADNSMDQIRKVVAEEAARAAATAVKEVLNEAQKKPAAGPTWASIASRAPAPPHQQQEPPRKVIPARQSREIIVRGSEMPPSLARRTPQEIVQAINQVSVQKGAIAARALPSGDVVVTFRDGPTRDWHQRNKRWIQEAFGEQAKEAQRTVAILIKGLRRADLQGVTEGTLSEELGFKSVDKVKIRTPTNPEYTRATVFVALTDQEEARRACDEGVVWRAQILDCEPFSPILEATQCYKCWQWGHTQRFCRKEPLCPRCGTQAHGAGGKEGESLCPTHRGLACRCAACGGKHTAWAKECPVGAQAWQKAREAYQYRPRSFEPLPQRRPATVQPAMPSTPRLPATPRPPVQHRPSEPQYYSDEENNDGFHEVRRKRGRGRPTGLENAAQSPTQQRLTFVSTMRTHPPPSQLSLVPSTQGSLAATAYTAQPAGTTPQASL
jgi:hypothetical protein